MFEAISSLFGYLMNFIYGLVQNYGIAIIVFTFLVKLLLLPLSIKQQKSLEKTQEMQPIVQELQRKYGNDQQKFTEEYQRILKEKNMTMTSGMGCSGCLISLIQLPIVLGMFYMMVNPLKYITKLDQSEIDKYKEEVNESRKAVAIASIEENSGDYSASEYDTMIKAANETSYVDQRYYEIDIIKDKNLMDMDFCGINLSDVAMKNKDNKALLIIPVLSALFTFLSVQISTRINNKRTGKTQKQQLEDSPVPMPDMRVMNIMMPVMLGYVAYSVPQGVGLYWATSNLLGVIQILALNYLKNNSKVKYKLIDDKSVKNESDKK